MKLSVVKDKVKSVWQKFWAWAKAGDTSLVFVAITLGVMVADFFIKYNISNWWMIVIVVMLISNFSEQKSLKGEVTDLAAKLKSARRRK